MRAARALATALAFGVTVAAWSAWALTAADRALDERGLAILAIVGASAAFGGLVAALSAPLLTRRMRPPLAIALLALLILTAWTLAAVALMVPVYASSSFDAYGPAWRIRPLRQILNAVLTGAGLGVIFLPQLMGLAAPVFALLLALLLGSRSTATRAAATAPVAEERR